MKKKVKKQKNWNTKEKHKKILGVLSAGAIGASLFMGYNRLTGNVVSNLENSTFVSLGGIAFFILGIVGVFLIVKEK